MKAVLFPFLFWAMVAKGQENGLPRVQARAIVERVEIDAFILDSKGVPIPGLGKADLKLLVDGLTVPVESVEWIPAKEPEKVLPPPGIENPAAKIYAGRLFVVFCQTDFGRVRAKGQMRLANEAQPFLDSLLPSDRVAVASFDSHLKLRLDFTNDKEAILAAIHRSLHIEFVDPLPSGPFPSLAGAISIEEARGAATVERGLELLARALKPYAGPKAILYLGWGLRVNHSPAEATAFGRALNALLDARVHVFTLDVTDADFHGLETTLKALSEATGGTYQKTNQFRGTLERVQKHLEGRYVIVFEKPRFEWTGFHKIELQLSGRKGKILVRPGYED